MSDGLMRPFDMNPKVLVNPPNVEMIKNLFRAYVEVESFHEKGLDNCTLVVARIPARHYKTDCCGIF